jgi:hypothetical protein
LVSIITVATCSVVLVEAGDSVEELVVVARFFFFLTQFEAMLSTLAEVGEVTTAVAWSPLLLMLLLVTPTPLTPEEGSLCLLLSFFFFFFPDFPLLHKTWTNSGTKAFCHQKPWEFLKLIPGPTFIVD